MTTAQSNRPDPFEASSGFSPEEAERLASSFKPSWEFDEAPFTQPQGGGMDASDLERLAAGGVNADVRGRQAPVAVPAVDERGSGHAKSAAAHAPPARVETHEPEVSVIIDRSITVSEMAHPPAAAPPVQAAPVLAPPLVPTAGRTAANPSTTAKRAQRREVSESLELPKSLRSSNKGLFVGIGVAAAAAVAILAIRAATASSDTPPAATPPAGPQVTSTPATPAIPPVPPPPAATAYVAPTPQPATPARTQPAAPVPHRAPPPPPHHGAPKSPPKAAGGGIVRDVPF